MTYLVTTNNTLLWSISLQPILHNYALARYSQYYIAMLSPVTANTTLICPTLLQPILHCYDLSRYPNNTLLWSISLQPILRYYELARYSQYFIAMLSLVTANTTLTWPILLQPILQRYDLSRTTNTKLYWYIYLIQHSLRTTNTKPIALLPMNTASARRCWRTPTDAHTRSG